MGEAIVKSFDSDFRKMAVFAVIANIVMLIIGVAVIAVAVKWVIS